MSHWRPRRSLRAKAIVTRITRTGRNSSKAEQTRIRGLGGGRPAGEGQKKDPKRPHHYRDIGLAPVALTLRTETWQPPYSSGHPRQVSSPSIPDLVTWGKEKSNNATEGCQALPSFGRDSRTRFFFSSALRIERGHGGAQTAPGCHRRQGQQWAQDRTDRRAVIHGQRGSSLEDEGQKKDPKWPRH